MEWIETLPDSRTLTFGQAENGMHWASIRDADTGLVDSATTCFTPNERNQWILEHTEAE